MSYDQLKTQLTASLMIMQQLIFNYAHINLPFKTCLQGERYIMVADRWHWNCLDDLCTGTAYLFLQVLVGYILL